MCGRILRGLGYMGQKTVLKMPNKMQSVKENFQLRKCN